MTRLWQMSNDETGTKDRMRTRSSSLSLENLSHAVTLRIFAGCSISSSSSRARFMVVLHRNPLECGDTLWRFDIDSGAHGSCARDTAPL